MSRHHSPHSHRHHEHAHPRQLARFDGLQGGQTGFLMLVAASDDVLELQLGADFVRLTRTQATELGCAVTAFLDLEEDERSGRPFRREPRSDRAPNNAEVVVQEVVEIVDELMTTERSPSSPPPSDEPRGPEVKRRGRGRSS